MRILLVSSAFYPYPSGISEHVYYLAKGLKELGHRVKVLTTNYTKAWSDKPIEDLEIIRFGKVFLIPLNKSFTTTPFSMDMPFLVKRFLETTSFDIIHMHGIYPPEIGFWVLHFSKTVNCVTFHTTAFIKNPFPKLTSYIFKKYIKKFSGKIAVSKAAMNWIEPSIPGYYRIIPNGVDCKRFSPVVSPINKKDKNSQIILFVGRLDERKGVLTAINAFSILNKYLPSVKLLIIGTGPLENKARKLTKELKINGSCLFLGYVKRSELPKYYTFCDVYISPALGGESQGIVLLEAMASGRAVLASDIVGYQEVIKNHETGIFFSPNSAYDLAQKIVMILKDDELRKRLEKNARIQAEKYDWKYIVRRINDYYLEISP